MAPETVTIPAAPAILPENLQVVWRKTYASAFEQAKADEPDDPARQRQLALREANRMLRTPNCTSAADLAKLAEWQVIFRGERDGQLKAVTMDGKKYSFPVQAGRAAAAEKKEEKKD